MPPCGIVKNASDYLLWVSKTGFEMSRLEWKSGKRGRNSLCLTYLLPGQCYIEIISLRRNVVISSRSEPKYKRLRLQILPYMEFVLFSDSSFGLRFIFIHFLIQHLPQVYISPLSNPANFLLLWYISLTVNRFQITRAQQLAADDEIFPIGYCPSHIFNDVFRRILLGGIKFRSRKINVDNNADFRYPDD